MYKEFSEKCDPTFSKRYIILLYFVYYVLFLDVFIYSFISGVPSLGLYPIDPLRITQLGIDQGNGPVSIKLNFRDLDISNIGTVKINEIL